MTKITISMMICENDNDKGCSDGGNDDDDDDMMMMMRMRMMMRMMMMMKDIEGIFCHRN